MMTMIKHNWKEIKINNHGHVNLSAWVLIINMKYNVLAYYISTMQGREGFKVS